MKLALYTIIVLMIQILSRILMKLYPLDSRWAMPDKLCYATLETETEGFYGDCV